MKTKLKDFPTTNNLPPSQYLLDYPPKIILLKLHHVSFGCRWHEIWKFGEYFHVPLCWVIKFLCYVLIVHVPGEVNIIHIWHNLHAPCETVPLEGAPWVSFRWGKRRNTWAPLGQAIFLSLHSSSNYPRNFAPWWLSSPNPSFSSLHNWR